MKKLALFFVAAVAVIAFGAGSARADRGFWFQSTSAGWTTYFNVLNTSSSAVVATATFYNMDGTSLGSTTHTIQGNGQWNFSSGSTGATAISTATLEAATGGRGVVKITGATTGVIKGFSTIANSSFAGFNFLVEAGQSTLAAE